MAPLEKNAFGLIFYRQLVGTLRIKIHRHTTCVRNYSCTTPNHSHQVSHHTRSTSKLCTAHKPVTSGIRHGSGRNILESSTSFLNLENRNYLNQTQSSRVVQSRRIHLATQCQCANSDLPGIEDTEHTISDGTSSNGDGEHVNYFYDKAFVNNHLTEMGLKFSEGYTGVHTTCPKLGIGINKKLPEESRLYINSVSGYFSCNHCKASGEWAQIQDNITSLKAKASNNCFMNVPTTREAVAPSKSATKTLSDALPISQLGEEQYETVLNMFDWQGIAQGTMAAYGVKCCQVESGYEVLFPVTSPSGVVIYVVKYSATPAPDKGYVVKKTTVPTSFSFMFGTAPTLFGWQMLQFLHHRRELVMTATEVDAMIVYQQTGILALSLPSLTAFPLPMLPSLEQFSKITLWIGPSLRDWERAKLIASKLNNERTYVFRPNAVTEMPLGVMQSGESLVTTVSKALLIGHKSIDIVQFGNLKSAVYKQLASIEEYSGVKWKKYRPMNYLLKGHRRGELTILTGPTGSGKTTFLADYSLDLIQQEVSTLWGSFEIGNTKLARVMLTQYAGKNLTWRLSEFGDYAEEFEKLPLFFLTFSGRENFTKVIEAMHHAVYVHDISHVIVDNLQVMMGMDYPAINPAINRFFRQDQVIDIFRKFAREMSCHVTLIIHPRKEGDGKELTLSSIFGSAKASQEADNVIVLQRQKVSAAAGRTYIQVLKNRFDGTLGVMMLKFNKESIGYTPVKSKKKQKVDIDMAIEDADENADDGESNIAHKQSGHG